MLTVKLGDTIGMINKVLFNMKDDNLYPQGNYTFRAYTTTMYGDDDISVYSSEITVVKDNVRPRNLTTPVPTDQRGHRARLCL